MLSLAELSMPLTSEQWQACRAEVLMVRIGVWGGGSLALKEPERATAANAALCRKIGFKNEGAGINLTVVPMCLVDGIIFVSVAQLNVASKVTHVQDLDVEVGIHFHDAVISVSRGSVH